MAFFGVAPADDTVYPDPLDGAEAYEVAPVAQRRMERGLLRDEGGGHRYTANVLEFIRNCEYLFKHPDLFFDTAFDAFDRLG